MRGVRRSEFERALGALDGDALAAFVAELWAAAGWETRVEGPLVVAERSGRGRRIAVVPAARGLDRLRRRIPTLGGPDLDPPGTEPDVVVDASGAGRVAAAARAAGAEYVPPETLRDRLLYGVPRDVGATLAERYLDRSLERIRRPSSERHRGVPSEQIRSASPDDPPAGSRPLLLGAVLAVLVVGALAVGPLGLLSGGLGPPGGPPADAQSNADGLTPSAESAGAVSAAATTATASATTTPGTTTAEPSYPPGLSSAGVENVSTLADAHVAATKNRQYAVNVSFDGPAAATGFGDFESVRWSLVVESRHHYRIDARYRGPNGTEPEWIRLGVYADGVTMFRRTVTAEGTRYTATPAQADSSRTYLYFASTMIQRYLDTEVSVVRPTVTAQGPRYHVFATGTPARLNDSVADYQAEALVTPEGRVTMLTARYTIEADGDERSVQVGFAYSDYGTALAEPPDWYETAKNETAG